VDGVGSRGSCSDSSALVLSETRASSRVWAADEGTGRE